MKNFIYYRSVDSSAKATEGYKYALMENFTHRLGEDFVGRGFFQTQVGSGRAILSDDGTLFIGSNFMWDGASGAVDTADFMMGSCIHDALCVLIDSHEELAGLWNAAAKEMRRVNRANGMSWLRAQWTYLAVRFWGRIRK